jgi:hypothetical protein
MMAEQKRGAMMEPKQTLAPAVALFLFLTLVAALVMYLSQQPPAPLPASAPPTEFSAERAFRHVAALATEPRPVGTAAHARARAYIVRELQALVLNPHIQSTSVYDVPVFGVHYSTACR